MTEVRRIRSRRPEENPWKSRLERMFRWVQQTMFRTHVFDWGEVQKVKYFSEDVCPSRYDRRNKDLQLLLSSIHCRIIRRTLFMTNRKQTEDHRQERLNYYWSTEHENTSAEMTVDTIKWFQSMVNICSLKSLFTGGVSDAIFVNEIQLGGICLDEIRRDRF